MFFIAQEYIEYQFQSEFTWAPDVIQTMISYTEYVMETVSISYVEALNSQAGHKWKLATHLEAMVSNLDSDWLDKLTRQPIDVYAGRPADNCDVCV